MKDEILKLLNKKPARYISKQYMGNELYNWLLSRTYYLKNESTISERIYHVIHDIFELPVCPHCKTPIHEFHTFNMDLHTFNNRFCSKECSAAYEYDMKTDHDNNIIYDKKDLITYVKENNIEKIKRNIRRMEEIKHYINDLIGDDHKRMKATEAIYFIKNDLKEYPKCPITKEPLFYIDKGRYRKHSSSKAAAQDKNTLEKRKQTVKEKYDVDNVSKSNVVLKKIQNTMHEKYKGKHYTQTEEYRNRLKTGDIKRIQTEEGNKRKIEANYKRAWERILSFSDVVKPLFSFEEYKGCGFDKQYKWLCVKTGKQFYGWYHQALVPKSPYIHDGTDIECDIRDYLKNNNIKFQKNTKSVIHPYEIDFYIPDHNLAIECNGLYWHSETMGKDRLYHLNKTKLCEDKGIRLIHIFSDEIINNPILVFSKLNSILKINKIPLYARKCKIKEIESPLKSKFLNKYHSQGDDRASIRLGLFYNNKLTSVMTFGKKRKAMGHTHTKDEYELIRYCNNFNFYIIGGASKLLKYFERKYKPKRIITYADKRWSRGDLYFKLGFEHSHDSKPNYFYSKNCLQRFHRFNFRKSQLEKKLENYDPNKTEWENMTRNGWHKIWDCGNMVFEKCYD